MSIPSDLTYTESHEWVRVEADGALTIGITDHAQEALGDVVFLELPSPGKTVAAGDAVAVIESVKAASDIYAPAAGQVVAVNSDLIGAPDQVNNDPYGAWLFKIKPDAPGATDQLMMPEAYAQSISA